MAIWAEKKAVKNVVDALAACPAITQFYPTVVAKRSGLPAPKAFEYLLQLTREEVLCLKWEVRCPEYCCARTVQTLTSLPDKKMFVECDCGEESEIDLDHLFPVFEIMPEYRQDVISEQQCKKKLKLEGKNGLN